MKVTPVAQSSGQVGQALGSAEVGRTAGPQKMEKAKAIARGETPAEPDPQAERVKNDVRRIKMRTQRSVYRNGEESTDPVLTETAQNVITTPAINAAEAASTNPESTEAPAVEATQPLSPQFAALAKQKRALQLERAEFEKQKAALPQGDAELITKLKANPLSVLQEHGVLDSPDFYNSVTERILSDQNGVNPEIQALKAKIEAIEKGVDSKFQSNEDRQEEAALTEMLIEAEGLAKEGEAFELIRERNAYDQVLRMIHSTYKKTGRVLDVSEAMGTIENQLLSDAEKLANLSKVRSKIAPPAQLQQQPHNQMRTLTARGTSTAPLSARQRAIAAFQGTLRK